MFFNSYSFALFFIIVFIFYWFVFSKKLKWQNLFLVLCSYTFYAFWDWRFLFLLAFSTLLDFVSGIMIDGGSSKVKRKFWLILSVGLNLGFLGFFKYYNFFIDSFAELLLSIGFTPHLTTLNIILPIGISFYTFHGLSYVFDIYYHRIKPTYNWADYTLFVSFFPLLVAGPIERATHLLPQVQKQRFFNYSQAVDGAKQFLWGLVKKVVIADNCGELVNTIFEQHETVSGSTLLLGAMLFSFQIYGDFSGYTDMALGSARMLGFELLKNFNYPYFSRSIAEFWRRWHISLTTWFRDYLYIPLGGSRGGMAKTIRNVFIIFLVSGLWHGANWTFIVWGGLNALFIMPSIIFKTNRHNLNTVAYGRYLPNLKELAQLIVTFLLASFAWIFFRSDTVSMACVYIREIFTMSLFTFPDVFSGKIVLLVLVFIIIEWIGREHKYAIQEIGATWSRPMRWFFYYILIVVLLLFQGSQQQFIYFQF